ncbi:hypothetical protein WOLCODRAFT_142871 [Wolfiporia cocos MD-104 SS10]|uniref:Sas10 C-terminal domain-containing protein n=1 Tax=Wolfiporia cocos (strain MD-104) TaxID=742152 RepID=A0A2H3JV38_WOLCO|nr:hypothetical protein WOLCODRAFT_142871 [Wolfiporia cocos MD-104 SS10]
MVRRRAGGKAKGGRTKARGVDPRESKINRWERAEDIPLDEEDQFHASKDRILLEGEDYGGEDDNGDEDEVFALKGISDESSDEEDDDDGQGYDEVEDEDEDEDASDADDVHAVSQKRKAGKAKAGKAKGKGKADSSSSESESEEEEEGWGKKKSVYYSSNAAQLESDDEEAHELEEQEARRLQAKTRDALADDDFGLGDPVEAAPEPDDVLAEAPTPVVPTLPQDKQGRIRHLEKTNPEGLALARDWDDCASKLMQSKARIEKVGTDSSDVTELGMSHVYYQALLTYTTTLAFYLHLRASEKYAQKPELLRSHPIFSRLLSLKKALATLEDLDFGLSDDEGGSSGDDLMGDAETLWDVIRKQGLEVGELEALYRDVAEDPAPARRERKTSNTKRKTKAAAQEEPPKKKRKTAKGHAGPSITIPKFDLVEPDLAQLSSSSSSSKKRAEPSAADVYGEATALEAADAADKTARKKSLRFHTSRIESTSARRAGARARAIGGDDDIPYRERKKEKEARLAKEAAAARGKGGDDLDGTEPQPRPALAKRAEEGDGDGSDDGGDENGYYELVQRMAKEKKAKKKADYEAAKAAARPAYDDESADGPRALTRAILKNKGLTPHRSKSVRNPRVKKRQRYEKAKRKVASQKAVYRGGIGETGRYDGERTGISRVIKGVRL